MKVQVKCDMTIEKHQTSVRFKTHMKVTWGGFDNTGFVLFRLSLKKKDQIWVSSKAMAKQLGPRLTAK